MGTINTVFLIGNGFDRNLELKTSYLEFYDYYLKQDASNNKVVSNLRKNIKTNKKTWSDLELRLGTYTDNIHSLEELEVAIFDLVGHLRAYLEKIEKSTDYSCFSREKLLKDLANPERVLLPSHQRSIREFKNKFSGNQFVQVQILTFNYTRTVENILEGKFKNIEIAKTGNQTIKLKGIEHIHGYVDQRLILGVNDINQISNSSLREIPECVDLLAKPKHNEQLGHLKDEFCLQQIANATVIYIFGSSIGETDKMWWEAIGNRIGQNCCLVIYYRAKHTDGNEQIREIHRARELVDSFLSFTNLDDQQKTKAKDYIYPATTDDLFKLKST